ncbi:hypothetical protein [uncultured Algibacter sp.]|uniref:hypothetical protein n=1 Tax=uncultured Algibacter sp. TaxID=298659 RepID=UPI0025DA3058|nr:hypothetical protein [uncultured Algibacter sp.]
MVKHIYPLLILFSFTLNLISQEAKISTKFSQDGNLYQTSTKASQTIAEFKENEKCIVTGYLGNYTYKIKYKDLVGFVKDQDLFVNEQMMDLYFDHEEKERDKAIQERKQKQEKADTILIQAAEEKKLIEQQRIDSMAKIENEAKSKLLEIKQNDSIAKVKEEQKIERIAQRKKDSINQAIKEQNRILAEKQKNDSITKAEDAAKKQLKIQKRNDSITQAKENQKKALEQLKKRNDSVVKVKAQQKIEAERKKNDSLTKVKEDKKKVLKELRKRNDSVAKGKEQQKTEAKRKKNDSLTQVKEDKKKALKELKKRNYSIAKAKAQEKALEEKRKKNTISQTKEEQSNRIIEKRRYDSIIKVRELETKQLIELRRQNDSIARIIEKERKEQEALRNRTTIAKEANTSNSKEEENKKATLLERIKYRDSCHYQINEYDRFYNITTIRTEPYTLNKNLTVELYKQGRKTDVFFNLSEDLGCATYLPNQRSSVKITLENNRIVNFYHSWDIECGELFLFKARLSSININILKKSPIKSIVIHGTQGYKEINFIEYKEFFIDKLKCIE